jgi:hypothetical protein
MPTYMMREIVNGKMIGHPVEADDEEEARAKFKEVLPLLLEQEADKEVPTPIPPSSTPPIKNEALNGAKFQSIEFQCSACGSNLISVFKDGYLQVDPCPTCLGELENMVSASKRFLDRKK